MERSEMLINIWNGEFPNYILTVPDLKKPHAMIGACLQVFHRLGIDNEAVLTPPPEEERDENMMYYWDLLPVINVTRVINHIVSVLQQADKLAISFPLPITHFLQPEASASLSILLLLVNLMAFNENRLKEISSQVAELFGKREQVKSLEEKKSNLLEQLNQQAEEKGKRAERLERIETDIMQFGDELKKEKEAHSEERKELEICLEEKRHLVIQLEQKKTQRDTLVTEVNRKKALRVYDAEDIQTQAKQAAQNVQEAEDKLDSLKASLMQKENCLKNLQKIKPYFDSANNLQQEIVKLTENMDTLTKGDLKPDTEEDELELMKHELARIQSQLSEVQAARTEFNVKRAEAHARRHLHKAQMQSSLREAEEKDRRCLEKSKRALQQIQDLKDSTVKCEAERSKAFEELDAIKTEFQNELESFDETLLKQVSQAEIILEKKLSKLRQ